MDNQQQCLETSPIAVSEIRIHGGTQPRCEINEELVIEYAQAMAGGAKFPPVVVFQDGVNSWLADGFHRTHAARRASIDFIAAEIHHGTKREAVLYSVGANAAHGQRRTNADKRKAVMTLLEDDEWSQWSTNDVAKQCSVSWHLVERLKSSLRENEVTERPSARTYTTKHGTTATMNTANIGKRRPNEPVPQVTQQPRVNSFESRGDGLRLAHEAIKILHAISRTDGLREEAFNTVINWIKVNR